MDIVFLTQVGGILKPFAWIMGQILNAIYEFINLFGLHNIALCIFIFTFVIKMLMLPLTIKQQKYTKLSSKMSPELQKITNKYKGKKDEVSLRKQQEETQAVYAKYGTSPMGGCLPLLISLPIMFALYRVIYSIPAYVNIIGDLYNTVANAMIGLEGHAEAIATFISENAITATNNLSTYAIGSQEYTNSLIDILAQFNTGHWDAIVNAEFFSSIKSVIEPAVGSIISANNLFGLNILDSPSWNSISVIIPIMAAGFQFLQGKMQTHGQNTASTSDNPMANSAKTMNVVMPLMSGVFCLMFPIGVGIYWIATSVFTIIQTIFINKYLDKTDLDEMIEKNLEKSNKKKAKQGIEQGNRMAAVAKTPTKSLDADRDYNAYKKNQKAKVGSTDYRKSNVSYSASSISANANLLAKNRPVNNKKPQADSQKDGNNSPENETGKE